ncbi:hypothetical protein KM043_011141 [Ampulex compressa]|nr:hypothetical protein KM043_011141 [Ampulex compressa]
MFDRPGENRNARSSGAGNGEGEFGLESALIDFTIAILRSHEHEGPKGKEAGNSESDEQARGEKRRKIQGEARKNFPKLSIECQQHDARMLQTDPQGATRVPVQCVKSPDAQFIGFAARKHARRDGVLVSID